MDTNKPDLNWFKVAAPLALFLLVVAVIVRVHYETRPARSGLAPLKPVVTGGQKLAPIAWGSSFDAALKTAKRSRKLVMVDFYTDG